MKLNQNKLYLAIIVSALGYFVDVFDIILFAVVRIPSLQALGLAQDEITSTGILLMNAQLVGMLLGGICWGIIGDKLGRLSVLFGSILLYSTANLLNAYVGNIEQYAVLRLLAGFGLAGEFGAGITLVSEIMIEKTRGFGITLITMSGALGGITAGLVGNLFPWTTAYILGGVAGFILLILRFQVIESSLFLNLKQKKEIRRGSLGLFFKTPALFKKYLKCLFVGVPFWIAFGLFATFSPEIARELKIQGNIAPGWAILFFNSGLAIGEISSGILSQWIGSRKKVAMGYLIFNLVVMLQFFSISYASPLAFYFLIAALGASVGYWVIFMMMASELFGTNIRSTVTVFLPNMVRGMVVPFTLILSLLKPHFGLLRSIELFGIVGIILAIIMVFSLKETYHLNLDFVEG